MTEPFVTTRNVAVGLGLTIIKRIAERHGGRLTVDSTLGVGTKITLVLPRKAQPHPEDQLIDDPTPGPHATDFNLVSRPVPAAPVPART